MSEVAQSEKNKKKKWLQTTLWVVIMIAFTMGLFYLIWVLQNQLKVSLRQYDVLAYFIVFGVSFLASCTIVLPAPGAAIVIAAAAIWNPIIIAMISSVGSTLGEITGYYAGYVGEKIIVNEQNRNYQRAVSWMKRYGIWTVLVIAAIPLVLFDVVGLMAGALRLPLWKFLIACWIGRIPKAFIEAYIGAGLIPYFFPSWFL
jgi:membrane protein YqaA with SNARE-associated domain